MQQQLWKAQSQLIVKFAWSQFALAEVEQSVYSVLLKTSKANLDSAQKRYQAGSIALVDFERAQIEALEIQRLYEQAMLNKQAAGRQLSNLWGGETSSHLQLNKTNSKAVYVLQVYIDHPDISEVIVFENLWVYFPSYILITRLWVNKYRKKVK